MASSYAGCPVCGHADLAPRHILVGQHITTKPLREYREILTLKCQNCGWLGEQLAESASISRSK